MSGEESAEQKLLAEIAKGELVIFTRDQAGHLKKIATPEIVHGILWITRKDNIIPIMSIVRWWSSLKTTWPVIVVSMAVVYSILNGARIVDWLNYWLGGMSP